MSCPTQVRGFRGGAVALSRGTSRQAVSRGAGKTLTGGQRAVQGGQTAAGVQQVRLLCDLAEQGVTLLTAGQRDKYKVRFKD